ncbi:MAG: hypothetical protein V3U92_19130 [Cellulophaga sp.]
MKIRITKGKIKNTLVCAREDGSSTSMDLGPSFPHHDIAHFVVESKFHLKNGFYGKIKSGMTIVELSDKTVIDKLDGEAWLAEILARNLQAISSKGATINQYIDLIKWEVENLKYQINIPKMTLEDVLEIKITFDKLCLEWDLLLENETLVLEFQ